MQLEEAIGSGKHPENRDDSWRVLNAVTFPFYFTHTSLTRSISLQQIHSSVLVVMGPDGDGPSFEQVHLTNKKRHVLRSVSFLFHKVREFRYLYWVPFCCEQITSQQKRSTMKKKKQKTTKKLNRSNAYHAPISPVKCLWSSRLRSSSRITLSSNAAAASTVAFGSKSSPYGIKAVPLPSKISFCSTVLNQICLSKKWTKNTEQTTPQ